MHQGGRACVQSGWLLFSSRSSHLQQERMSASSRGAAQLSKLDQGQPQPRPCRGTVLALGPPGHRHHGPGSAGLSGLREPLLCPLAVTRRRGLCQDPRAGTGSRSSGIAAAAGWELCRDSGTSRQFSAGPQSVSGWDTASTCAETLSVERSPALPCSAFKEPGGNPLPTQSDPNQILPLTNTFRFRLRTCRSSA